MNDYNVKYILDGRQRNEIIVADNETEARQLFQRVHPTLTIVAIELLD